MHTLHIEWDDGSLSTFQVEDKDEAWRTVEHYEFHHLHVLSAWYDDEPWLGLCTDFRPGTP